MSVKFFTTARKNYWLKQKEFDKDKIDQVEKLDENDMNTLIMVIKSLNEKDERPAT